MVLTPGARDARLRLPAACQVREATIRRLALQSAQALKRLQSKHEHLRWAGHGTARMLTFTLARVQGLAC